ncbi:hypothetical protein [Gimesia sp.]|uniref:hypothetical protein n=1 Tax=Gimesia sp. TaxID=2024833 RepID=UPI003A8D1577
MRSSSVEVLNISEDGGKFVCQVERFSVPSDSHEVVLSWNDTKKRRGFVSIGDDVAFVKASPGDVDHQIVPASLDQLGDNEFAWRDTAHRGSVILILILPTDYIIREIGYTSPPATRFKVFENRLAFYWDIGEETTDLRWKMTRKGNRNLERLCGELNKATLETEAEKKIDQTSEIANGSLSGDNPDAGDNLVAHYIPELWEKVTVATLAAVVLLAVLYAALQQDEIPARNFALLRIILSFAMGVMGGVIPGFLHVDLSFSGSIIRAGGGLALGIVTFFFTPQVVPNDLSSINKQVHSIKSKSSSPEEPNPSQTLDVSPTEKQVSSRTSEPPQKPKPRQTTDAPATNNIRREPVIYTKEKTEGSTRVIGNVKVISELNSYTFEIEVKTRKTGISGTGKGVVEVQLLDNNFQPSPPISVQKTVGSDLTGKVEKSNSKTVSNIPADKFYGLIWGIKTSDSIGFPTTITELNSFIKDEFGTVIDVKAVVQTLRNGESKSFGDFSVLRMP